MPPSPLLSAALEPVRERLGALGAGGRRRLAAAAIAVVGVAAIAVVLVTSGPSTAGEAHRNSFLARLVPSPEQFARPASPEATRAARGMSIAEKVDQLMLLGFEGSSPGGIAKLAGDGEPGGVVVAEENYTGKRQLRRLVQQAKARAKRRGRVPPAFLVSQEGGELSALADVPPKTAPADTASVEAAAKQALASARQLKRLGLDGVLGPVLDVGPAAGSPLGLRVFSDDPREVARYARATVSAYVGERLISAPLHFPGLGNAPTSTDEGPAQVGQTIDDLRRSDLLPFRVAIDAGAHAIVVGHGLYGTDDFAVPASQSRFLLNDLLRQELGFEGLAITDDLAAGAITISQSSAEAAVASIAAGADTVRLSGPPEDQDRTRAALLAAVRSGRISRRRLDTAVMRMLEVKRAAGLLPRVRRRERAPAPRTPAPARPAAPAHRPTPGRPQAESIPGLDRREGRPPAPGGAWPRRDVAPRPAAPPPPPRPSVPGLGEREGRPPGPGGVRQRAPRPRPATQAAGALPGQGVTPYPSPGVRRYVPGAPTTGTRTYTIPVR